MNAPWNAAQHGNMPQHRSLPRLAWLLVPLLAGWVVAPMLVHGFSCGHDLTFHMTNWFEAAHQWRQGILYPRWAAGANYTAGEPRFVFYPPLSWMLGAAITSVIGLFAAPLVYVFLVLCAAGVAMYRLARVALLPAAALAAALLYMANPYMLFVVYTRSAYAELLAAAVLPLLLLAVLRPRVHVALLAEVVAVLWLTNAPAAVIGMYCLLVLAVLAAWRHRSAPNLLRTAAGTALGLGLAAIYLLPAAVERSWVQIGRVTQAGYEFRNNFLFGGMGEPLHDAVLHQASVIAVALVGVIAAALVVLLVQRRHWHTLQNRVFYLLAILAAVVLFLLLPVSGFVWRHAPELAYLQFPWRFLMVLAPVAALLVAAGVAGMLRGRLALLGVALAVSFLATAAGVHVAFQPCDVEDTPRSVVTQLRSGLGQEGTDEYTPVGADTDDLQADAPRVWFYAASEAGDRKPSDHLELPEHAEVLAWSAEHKHFRVQLSQPAVAILQLMDYPAWQVSVAGKPTGKARAASSGQVQVALPAGTSDVELRFVKTPDRILADGISLLGLLLLVLVTWRERHHHSRPAEGSHRAKA